MSRSKARNEVGKTAFKGLRSYLRGQGLFQVERGNLYWVLRGLLHERFDCTIQVDIKKMRNDNTYSKIQTI